CGAMEVLSGALRGMGASVITLFIAILGVCGVRLGWIFTVFRMEAYHTLESLYFSYIISWLMCIFAQSIAFVFVYKKQKKLHQTSV
ncbi:MAG: MATE family efflux transporter, partial [Oscillospiraceae bacterium]|nr:MATE family efflux transporter [Oscillospiraceae bacterium]